MRKAWAGNGFLLAGILFFLACPVFGRGRAAAADYITGSGCSVSNVGYLSELAKEYEMRTGTKVFVRGGGSVIGIEDLRRGKVDFAAACRGREGGDPQDIQFVQVAWDVLVFIVNPSNPVDTISLDQVRGIYSRRFANWSQLKGADMSIRTFIARPRKGLSGVEASISRMVLGGKEPAASANIVAVSSSGIAEQMVEDTPAGFATSGYASARKRKVKMLKVDGVAPSFKNIVSGRYLLRRPLYILTSKHPAPDVKKFLDFVTGRQGQQFIQSQGVVPVMDVK
ncbi:MAG: substrate-binding domain-containing protein [Nitrospiraceae bacterium]|nr:substrate-binding domain-containing protein [Nitrospiraceae bacterium]